MSNDQKALQRLRDMHAALGAEIEAFASRLSKQPKLRPTRPDIASVREKRNRAIKNPVR